MVETSGKSVFHDVPSPVFGVTRILEIQPTACLLFFWPWRIVSQPVVANPLTPVDRSTIRQHQALSTSSSINIKLYQHQALSTSSSINIKVQK
jgi:hypothetical protein